MVFEHEPGTDHDESYHEYMQNLAKVGLIVGGGLTAWQLNKAIAKVGWTKLGILGVGVGTYAAIQGVGLGASYLIAGDEGLEDWMYASNKIFTNRTFLDEIPVVGDLMTLLPNPLGVFELGLETTAKVYEHYKDPVSEWIQDLARPKFFNPTPFVL